MDYWVLQSISFVFEHRIGDTLFWRSKFLLRLVELQESGWVLVKLEFACSLVVLETYLLSFEKVKVSKRGDKFVDIFSICYSAWVCDIFGYWKSTFGIFLDFLFTICLYNYGVVFFEEVRTREFLGGQLFILDKFLYFRTTNSFYSLFLKCE